MQPSVQARPFSPRLLLPLLGLCLGAELLHAQSPVDLGTWSAESYDSSSFADGVWTPAAGGTSVIQSVNGDPTFYVGDFEILNSVVEGKLKMLSAGGDDDMVGFAIGFLPGDSLNAAADYLLIDWKRSSQGFDFNGASCTPGTTATLGLAVSRATGIPTGDEFWGHTNFDDVCSDLNNGLQELQRAANLGSTGWTFNQDYLFRFEYDGSHLRVFVDGVLELDVTGNFPNGRLAFYNFSQAQVEYSAFTYACPASWNLYGTGWTGTNGIPTMSLDAEPVLGTTVNLALSNSRGLPTDAFLFQARSTANLDVGLGGALLLGQPYFLRDIVMQLPANGGSIPIPIPNIPALCAQEFFVQAFLIDPGASHGVAFTGGMRAVLGE